MATWSKDIRACKTTWTTLRILDQNDRTFDESGDVKMQELTYWNPTASSEARKLEAEALAKELDNIFRTVRGADFEEGVTLDQALAAMVGVLSDGEKMIADLAEANDACYHFFAEDEDE